MTEIPTVKTKKMNNTLKKNIKPKKRLGVKKIVVSKLDTKMTGNQFWKLRSKHGRDRLFENPQMLWQAACEYFDWCEANPLIEVDFKGKDADRVELPKMRAFTMQGLCLYIGCNVGYFNDFELSIKKKESQIDKDFSVIITRIRETIYNQKFTGAAAGFLNSNIIARDLGLTDKQDITSGGEKLPQTVIKWGNKEIKV